MGSQSLGRYHFYSLIILKEMLTFLSLSNLDQQYHTHTFKFLDRKIPHIYM